LSILLLMVAGIRPLAAVSESGDGWTVHYNLPDSDTTYDTSRRTGEYALRELLLKRLGALRHGDEALLASFTFSGDSNCCGGAGPILDACEKALKRGARVGLVVGGGVSLTEDFGGQSIARLAARSENPLRVSRDDAKERLMHHKLAVLAYGESDRRVITTSWNFTGGASSLQWNIALELMHAGVYDAYRAEMVELLAGAFHDHEQKSRDHDPTVFRLPGDWGPCEIRFGPFADPDRPSGRDEILEVIRGAEAYLLIAIPRLTLREMPDALIAAADRGVRVEIVLPRADIKRGGASVRAARKLRRRSAYATDNRVRFVTARISADDPMKDRGQRDLVHVKYLVADPAGRRPIVVHGSANWTYSALVNPRGNDENIVVLRHEGIAQAFTRHYMRMTGRLK